MSQIHELEDLDVTDSMQRDIEIISQVLDTVDTLNKNDALEKLDVIHQKVVEIEEYFWRPLDSPKIYERLREIASQLGEEDKAQKYESQLALFKANELEFKGRVQDFFGNKKRALEFYSKALELVPDHELASPAQKKAEKNIEKAQKELAVVERKLEIHSEDPKLWLRYGLALVNLGEVERAIQCFDKVIELEPQNPDAWARRGCAMESLGDFFEAKRYLEKALELKPTSLIAKRGLNYADYFLEYS
jgi:tetratricopeptide (TPR) repeat protein